MSNDSQKAQDVLEQIKRLKNKSELQTFEDAHLQALIESPPEVRSAIDMKHKELTGQYLFAPITSMPQPESRGPLHPRMSNYRTTRRIVGVEWDKIKETRRAGTVIIPVEFFHLTGHLPDGSKQTIDIKLGKEQLANRFSKETAKKIIDASGLKGFMKCDEEVSMIGYWEVIFSNKSAPNDTDEVLLTHEGVCLQIKRNLPVILPGYYLEVSDHGIYPKYIQTPEHSRKVTAWVQFYPYTALRESSEREYLASKAKGDAIERDERRRREVVA